MKAGENFEYPSSLTIRIGGGIYIESKIRNKYTNGKFVTHKELEFIMKIIQRKDKIKKLLL